MDKENMGYVHTHTHTHTRALIMEYYSVLKRKEILTYAATWVNFGNTVLSEIKQIQKNKCCMIPVKCLEWVN